LSTLHSRREPSSEDENVNVNVNVGVVSAMAPPGSAAIVVAGGALSACRLGFASLPATLVRLVCDPPVGVIV
jgi:hypothetical protein